IPSLRRSVPRFARGPGGERARRGEEQARPGPYALRALDAEGPAVGLGDGPADGEPEPRPAGLDAPRPVHAVEPLAGARQVLREPGEPLDFFEHRLDDLPVLPRLARIPQGDLALGAEHGERRPQLVGRVRGEAPDLLEGTLEPGDHLVQRPGEPPELVAGIR